MIRRLMVLAAVIALIAALFLPSGILGMTIFPDLAMSITVQKFLIGYAIVDLVSIFFVSIAFGRCAK